MTSGRGGPGEGRLYGFTPADISRNAVVAGHTKPRETHQIAGEIALHRRREETLGTDVSLKATLYEDVGGSCGAEDNEDSFSIPDTVVPPEAVHRPSRTPEQTQTQHARTHGQILREGALGLASDGLQVWMTGIRRRSTTFFPSSA